MKKSHFIKVFHDARGRLVDVGAEVVRARGLVCSICKKVTRQKSLCVEISVQSTLNIF